MTDTEEYMQQDGVLAICTVRVLPGRREDRPWSLDSYVSFISVSLGRTISSIVLITSLH